MKNRKFWIILLSLLIFIPIGIPGIGFCILKWGILSPDRLTYMVEEQYNTVFKNKLACERVELVFFETYPRLGVQLYGGTLTLDPVALRQELKNDVFLPSDTLFTFNPALISINLLDYKDVIFRDNMLKNIFVQDRYVSVITQEILTKYSVR